MSLVQRGHCNMSLVQRGHCNMSLVHALASYMYVGHPGVVVLY